VITDDQVVALFAKANPVPSLDLIDPIEPVSPGHLEDPSERSREMTDLKTVESKDASRRRRSWLVPAFAGIAIVVGLAVVPAWDRGPASPQDVADAYMEARQDLDTEAITGLFAPDATVREDDFDLSEMPALIEFWRATGWDWTPTGCTEISSGPAYNAFTCGYEFENDWTRALDHPPVTGGITLFIGGDEISQITSLTSNIDRTQLNDVWRAVIAWMTANHPDDTRTMYTDDMSRPELHPAAIALWERYTDEYVAEIEG